MSKQLRLIKLGQGPTSDSECLHSSSVASAGGNAGDGRRLIEGAAMLNHLKNEANKILTENGAVTYASTLSDCLDLFATIGAIRRESDEEIITRFSRAFAENADIAMKLLFFGRDVRGGRSSAGSLGERRVFRVIVNWLTCHEPAALHRNIAFIPEYGRFDDLIALMGTACEKDALVVIREQLHKDLSSKEGGSLLAKWLSSVNASNAEIVRMGKKIARALGMTDAEYRRTLVKLRARIRIIENNLREKDYTFDYVAQPPRPCSSTAPPSWSTSSPSRSDPNRWRSRGRAL